VELDGNNEDLFGHLSEIRSREEKKTTSSEAVVVVQVRKFADQEQPRIERRRSTKILKTRVD